MKKNMKSDKSVKTIEIVLPNDYKIIAIEKSSTIIDEIWKEKIYEKDFEIQPGMTVLDIGANQGFFSIYAASKGANVIAVEPEEINYKVLTENIRKNALENKIKALQYAISSQEGRVELYSYDFNEQYASGMVSTTKEFIDKVNLIIKKEIRTSFVESISLKRLFEMENSGKINLLKIDCEGAEYDILKSATPDIYDRVENIVMETHDTYSEKDIFHLVKEMGYNVINYNKLSGLYKTGYLFAQKNTCSGNRGLIHPIMIIEGEVPLYEFIGYRIHIDATKSFSTSNRNTLKFNWKLDGECFCNNTPLLDMSLIKTGVHTIDLELTDDYGNSTSISYEIFIFCKEYFVPESKVNNLVVKERYHFACFSGKNEFSLEIPKDWAPYRIILEITYISSKKERHNTLEFNGRKMNLNNEFNEIGINNFSEKVIKACKGVLKINFTISLIENEQIEIYCWHADKKYFEHRDSMLRFFNKMKNQKNGDVR